METNQQREKLECKIMETFSELLLLKERNKHDSEEFNSLRTKLAGNIWKWAGIVFQKVNVENAGEEIMQCVKNSITSFEDSVEKYISYISVSIKNEIRRANEKLKSFESSAISFPQKKQRQLKQMILWAEQYGKNISDPEVQERLAAIFGTSKSEINELLRLQEQSRTTGEKSVDEDGNENSVLDEKSVSQKSGCGDVDFDSLIESEKLNSCIEKINDAYLKSQDRTKQYLSALITRQFLHETENANIEIESVIAIIQKKPFAEAPEAKKIIEFFQKNELPTQEEVASWFVKDKTDASRTMRKFLEKMNGSR
ncbi:MAG: hypothetical protein J6O39_04265 [Treponema sp.]|nr:hypothetical protein [Treponema sp.]MBP3772325.1 hypothetical protein [Treponema sp.]